MIRSLFVLALASSLAVACSRPAPQQAADGSSAPPPAAAPAAAPQSGQGTAATTPAGQAPPASAAAPAATAAQASTPAPPPEPPKPKFKEVTIPTGTSLSVALATPLASNSSKPEDRIKGALAKPVVISGATALPKGADLSGSVIEVKESGRVKGKAEIVFQFDHMTVRGESLPIAASRITSQAQQDKKQDVRRGAVGGGLGAVVGGIAGGGKGAAIGAVAGSAGTVLATKGNEVSIEAGTVVSTVLQEPLKVTVPVD